MKRHSYVQFVFRSTCFSRKQNLPFKVRLFSFLNTKQTNDGNFLKKTRENFNLAKIFCNVRANFKRNCKHSYFTWCRLLDCQRNIVDTLFHLNKES